MVQMVDLVARTIMLGPWVVKHGALGFLVFKEKLHSCELNTDVGKRIKEKLTRKKGFVLIGNREVAKISLFLW